VQGQGKKRKKCVKQKKIIHASTWTWHGSCLSNIHAKRVAKWGEPPPPGMKLYYTTSPRGLSSEKKYLFQSPGPGWHGFRFLAPKGTMEKISKKIEKSLAGFQRI